MKNFEVQHTVRLYDPELIAAIGRVMDSKLRDYRNKNEFLTEVIRLGIKQMKGDSIVSEINAATPNCVMKDAFLNELSQLHTLSAETAQYIKMQFKKIYVHIAVVEKLLAAIYNIEIGELSGTPPLSEKVEDGFFDDLPMRFEKIIISLENRYGLR